MTHLQTISLYFSPSYASPLFMERISPIVTDRLKRIGVIALAAIVSLVTCCVAILHLREKRRLKDLTSIKEHYRSLGRQVWTSDSSKGFIDIAAEIQNFFKEIPTLENPHGIDKETPNSHVLRRLQDIKELLDNPKVDKEEVFFAIAISLAENKRSYYYRVTHLNKVLEPFQKSIAEQASL